VLVSASQAGRINDFLKRFHTAKLSFCKNIATVNEILSLVRLYSIKFNHQHTDSIYCFRPKRLSMFYIMFYINCYHRSALTVVTVLGLEGMT